ncbi:hypothetical protein CcrColossus_gp071 [Caulobacter phage CcrColossus]|uniref:Uncharacterized protein n=1 Tax=Caulobacter phage CcrColossus TaxID=1211640 RepID=K4JS67_9CAUD|nr:hypothetical protein CcrColossus_gp071 [Caulobacter phage CcrColossus]AFU87941.1 hypothetical protein CcrColossus_gp071 [Caulobacter phage CcrColossus]
MSRELYYVTYEANDELIFLVGTEDADEAEAWREWVESISDVEVFADVRSVRIDDEIDDTAFALICDDDDELYLFESLESARTFISNENLSGAITKGIKFGVRTFMERPL